MCSLVIQTEIERIISSLPWNCRLVHSDGTAEDFEGFLAEWGRPFWIRFDASEAPIGRNRYVILGTTEAPTARPTERLEVERNGLRKVLQVLQCQVLDYKKEYVCEELV